MPVSASLVRLVAACCVLVALALVVPQVVPGLLTRLVAEPSADGAAPDPAARSRPRGGYQVAIPADRQGHFVTDATVEGRAIRVVVDTGATSVALTADTAHRLGIHLTDADYTKRISTANGVTAAAPVVLAEIRLGDISIRDVAAVVVPGDGLDINLLGMTFLSRLTRFEIGGGQLVLSD